MGKKKSLVKRITSRFTDKDIKVGRKRYNILNLSFASFGITMVLWIYGLIAPGKVPPEWTAVTLLGGFALLVVDGVLSRR